MGGDSETKAVPKTSVKLPSEVDFSKKTGKPANQPEKDKGSKATGKSAKAGKTAAPAAPADSTPPATPPKVTVPKACPFQPHKGLQRRLKAFFWGATGSGKTTLAMSFPSPAMIDADGGAKLYAEANNLNRTEVQTWDEAVQAVDWLLQNPHLFKTLIVDPITKLWEMLQWKWNAIFLKRNRGGFGHKFDYYKMQIADWAPLKAEFKQFVQKLLALDMNIIVTAREKDLFSDSGDLKKVGLTFDGEKNLPYEFDLVLRLAVDNKDGKHYATVVNDKDRTRNLPWVKPLPLGKPFEISFGVLRDHLGADWLEAPAQEVEYFASKADQRKIAKAFKEFQLTKKQARSWFAKHDADSMGDLSKDGAAKILAEITVVRAKRADKAGKK